MHFKNRIFPLLLLSLTAILLLASIGASRGRCGGVISGVGSGCRVASQEMISWEQKPQIIDGYLLMSGTTKNGNQLHDPTTVQGNTRWPTFVLNNYRGESEDRPGYLEAVGSIYSASVASRLSG